MINMIMQCYYYLYYNQRKQHLFLLLKNQAMQQRNKALILNRYEIIQQICETQYKKIYLLHDHNTCQQAIMKVQRRKGERKGSVLKQGSFLTTMQGYPGIPELIWSGKTEKDLQAIIVSKLGDTLDQRLQICGGQFSLKTVLMLGVNIFRMINSIHIKGFIHRNIGINIFQFGIGTKCNELYINDLLDSKVYLQFQNRSFILKNKKFKQPKPPQIFSSITTYHGRQLSLRDDVESCILLLIYLLKGNLPWQQCFINKNVIKIQQINKNNRFTDPKILCEGLPYIFIEMIQKVRSLKFSEEPNYSWFMMKMKQCMYIRQQQFDDVYDWILNKKFMQRSAIKTVIPAVFLDDDIKFLEQFYKKYGQQIDIDEVGLKHQNLMGKAYEQDKKKVQFQESFNITKNNKQKRNKSKSKQKQACHLM